jgi:hypothetical protein
MRHALCNFAHPDTWPGIDELEASIPANDGLRLCATLIDDPASRYAGMEGEMQDLYQGPAN